MFRQKSPMRSCAFDSRSSASQTFCNSQVGLGSDQGGRVVARRSCSIVREVQPPEVWQHVVAPVVEVVALARVERLVVGEWRSGPAQETLGRAANIRRSICRACVRFKRSSARWFALRPGESWINSGRD